MNQSPDFPTNVNTSIPSGGYESQGSSAPGFQIRDYNNSLSGYDQSREFDQNNGPPPSFSGNHHGGNSSVGGDSRVLGTTTYGSGPDFDGVGHQNTSKPGLGTTTYGSGPDFDGVGPQNTSKPGLDSHATSDNKAPGHSAHLHQNTSATANATTTAPAPVNPLDYVGISLVGRKFKAVNPDAYYVEKNENY